MVENEDAILRDCRRVIEAFHDNNRYAMLRIALAPCSPFSVSQDLMRVSAELARSYPGVRLHTHLAETQPDVEYSLAKFGLTPGDYAEDVGWVGEDVWHAHCVHLTHRCDGQIRAHWDRESRTVRPAMRGWRAGSRRCARCLNAMSRWDWASMVRPATTAAICSTRRAWRC